MDKRPHYYFENLDGLRFFCFLSVFFFHSFHTDLDYIKDSSIYIFVKREVFGNGNLGVNFFFVLSGFLITFLLIMEIKYYGHINIKKFWGRRILRIWPLYFMCLVIGFLIFPVLKSAFGERPAETANWLYYVFFVNNFDFLWSGPPDASILGVLWSIAVEEQFYFVWPILLSIVSVRHFKYALGLLLGGSILFRFFYPGHDNAEYHTLSCMGDLVIGGLGAVLIQHDELRHRLKCMSRSYLIVLYIMVALIYFFRDEVLLTSPAIGIFDRPFIAAVFLLVILEQCYAENSFYKMKNFKTATELGVIAYGLYCLHFVGILVATRLTKLLTFNTQIWQVLLLETACALMITVILAKLSFRFLEQPFLRMKRRLEYVSTIK